MRQSEVPRRLKASPQAFAADRPSRERYFNRPRRAALCGLAALALSLAGCWGEPRLDLHGDEAFEQSYAAIKKSLPPADRDRLRRILIFSLIYYVSGYADPQVDPAALKNFYRGRRELVSYGGGILWASQKTASEIFAEAKRLRIPDDPPSVEELIVLERKEIDRLLPPPDPARYQALRDEVDAFGQVRDHIVISHVRVTMGARIDEHLPETFPRLSFHIVNKGTSTLAGLSLRLDANGPVDIDIHSFPSPVPPNAEQDVSYPFSGVTAQIGAGFRNSTVVFEAVVRDMLGRDLRYVVLDAKADGKWLRLSDQEASELETLNARIETRKRGYNFFSYVAQYVFN